MATTIYVERIADNPSQVEVREWIRVDQIESVEESEVATHRHGGNVVSTKTMVKIHMSSGRWFYAKNRSAEDIRTHIEALCCTQEQNSQVRDLTSKISSRVEGKTMIGDIT